MTMTAAAPVCTDNDKAVLRNLAAAPSRIPAIVLGRLRGMGLAEKDEAATLAGTAGRGYAFAKITKAGKAAVKSFK
ncbi:hypothetical protein ATO13_23341 [Stappia sp. 22II-S9-Z10]|nr:hypothetical protein ATO13_23341 [Stappia sp. 22II-S9-Z10]